MKGWLFFTLVKCIRIVIVILGEKIDLRRWIAWNCAYEAITTALINWWWDRKILSNNPPYDLLAISGGINLLSWGRSRKMTTLAQQLYLDKWLPQHGNITTPGSQGFIFHLEHLVITFGRWKSTNTALTHQLQETYYMEIQSQHLHTSKFLVSLIQDIQLIPLAQMGSTTWRIGTRHCYWQYMTIFNLRNIHRKTEMYEASSKDKLVHCLVQVQISLATTKYGIVVSTISKKFSSIFRWTEEDEFCGCLYVMHMCL
jgi:hypothetical protein